MKYEIKRGNDVVATVRPTGRVLRRVMGEDQAELQFMLRQKVNFVKHDYIIFKGRQYTLLDSYTVAQNNNREWVYNITFLGLKYKLREVSLLFYDQDNQLTVPNSYLVATAQDMLSHVVVNANRLQSGWSVGDVDETIAQNVQFDDMNCLNALAKIADAFKLEYWIDADKSIHFTERKIDTGITLEYGKSRGLKNLIRTPLEGASLVTRLYVKGGERNLPQNYRNGQKNLRMDVPYLEANTSEYGVIEHTETFEDIFPKRTGTVTAVDATDPMKFSDNTMNFDLNAVDGSGNTTVLIPNLSAKIKFQTGQLAGYTFEIKERGYDSQTKTFTILQNKDETSWDVPSETIRPAVGDEYILLDIQMPQSYVTDSEADLKQAGQDYLEANSVERYTYQGDSDPLTFAALNFQPEIGNLVTVKSGEFDLNDSLRINGTEEDLNNLYDIQLDFSDVAFLSPIVTEYYEQEKKQEQEVRQRRENDVAARLSYLFAREAIDHAFDPQGMLRPQVIRANSIDAGMINLGYDSQQFSIPDIRFRFLDNYTKLDYTAGQLRHQSIDPNGIRTWNITAGTLSLPSGFVYVYAKCQKEGSNGTIVASVDQKVYDEDETYYHFWVGYVSSVIDDYRIMKPTHGFAQINPAEISIGRWSSPNSNDYIQFGEDGIEVYGKITFAADSPAKDYIDTEVSGLDVQLQQDIVTAKNSAEQAAKAYADAQDVVLKTNQEAYADGVLTEAEQKAISEANAALQAAKQHAEDQDNILNDLLENYTDTEIGKIDFGSRNLIQNGDFSDPVVNNGNSNEGWFSQVPNRQTNDDYNYVEILGYRLRYTSEKVTEDTYSFRFLAKSVSTNNNKVVEAFIQDTNNNRISDSNTDIASITIGASDWVEIRGVITNVSAPSNRKARFLIQVSSAMKIAQVSWVAGNKPPKDFTSAPEDVEAKIQAAKHAADQADQAATVAKNKTDWLEASGNGGAWGFGTLLLGNNQQGNNAGITGQGTSGNSTRYWSGEKVQSNGQPPTKAPWRVRDDGVWEQWFNGKLVRQTGVINGEYQDVLYDPNDLPSKRIRIIDGYITEEWLKDGVVVYQIGRNGIYYVKEVPESWSLRQLVALSGTTESALAQSARSKMCFTGSAPNYSYQWVGNPYTTAYLYSAGQNVNSESNKQYEGYKTSNSSRTSNISNGWYCDGLIMSHVDGSAMLVVNNIVSGKVTDSMSLKFTKGSMNQCPIG